MNLMAVDPGFSGGIAVMTSAGKLEFYRKMPVRVSKDDKGKKIKMIDAAQVAAIIAKFEPAHVFIEKAQAMPTQGVVSMFNYGVGYGMILGLCLALEQVFETHPIPPQRWHRFMCSNIPGAEDADAKTRAKIKFYELWPEMQDQNVTHDGIIDAVLLADYGRRILSLN